MGKKVVPGPKACPSKEQTQSIEIGHKKHSEFSISESKYLQFFGFLKELHLTPIEQKAQNSHLSSSLSFITNSLMNFFNHAKGYTSRQLECSTICLANLFNAISDKLDELTFSRQFIIKLRRFTSDLAQSADQLGYQQKVQAILYILAMLIYKEKTGEVCPIRDLNNSIFSDRMLMDSLLKLILPKQKKISKFYGIVIVYLSSRKNNHKWKKLIIKSIFSNLKNMQHEFSLLSLLVYLRNEKNKVTINLKDIQEGDVVEMLVNAYPRHIHEYHSFYILDYLHHILVLFPSLALQVTNSKFIPYLLETAGPTNLHHPMHESTIIAFIESTLKYLDSALRQHLIEEITKIQPFNQFFTIKLVDMLIDFDIGSSQLLVLAYKGYFDRLLEVISRQEEGGIRKRTAEQYLKVVEKVSTINEATSAFMFFKIRTKVQHLNNTQLMNLVASSKIQNHLNLI